MSKAEQKYHDAVHVLERLLHRTEGSLHAYSDVYSVGFSLGFEPEYMDDLFRYLKVNGMIEILGESHQARLTPYGARLASRSELAA